MFFFSAGRASPQGKPSRQACFGVVVVVVVVGVVVVLLLLLVVLLYDCLSACLKEKKRVWPAIILTPSHR